MLIAFRTPSRHKGDIEWRQMRAPKQRSGLARFAYAIGGLLLILAGVLLVILGSNEFLELDLAGWTPPPEAPGLIVIGFLLFFRSARRVRGDEDHDPDSRRALPRDIDERLDDVFEDDR